MISRNKPSRKALIIGGLALAFLAIFPLFSNNNYFLSVGVTFCVFASLGSAWNLIGGYAAQISWCHATFVAIGAYTSYLLYIHLGISPWIGMLAGMALSSGAALFIGNISFRLRGPFFSLSTIAFAELVRVYLQWHKDLTKGANGLVVTFKEDSFVNLMFSTVKPYYYIMLGVLVVSVFVCWNVARSRLGYYLKAIKADEDAVNSLGISSNEAKMKAFVISALIASAVGTVYAFFLGYIDPQSFGSLDLSTKIGSMAIVGGLGTIAGPLIGAAFLVPLSEVANILLGSAGAGMLLYGLSIMLVFTFRPEGIVSLFKGKKADPATVPVKTGKAEGTANE
ncbi:branched-chain amino acid ABC transporter permease [Oscillospiraceae bacterium MB08-C2-2]|nr:branched-chain amino acid ABC transporter permease [Oscillospiraceae bacterium MB08-C2-2]